jgi:formate-dependent nitrite reductase membrane component NrfD
MLQERPWDFMVKDTHSRDWTEGMGAMITVAFFCGGIAGGLYLYSLYLNNLWGMFIGWVFALAMGMFDFIHLKNKKILWKIATRPNSSWISRGFLFVILFIGTAAIQMALTFWSPSIPLETAFKVISGIMAVGVASYSGFVVSYISGVKFWHSTVMPLLFIVAGLTGGAAIILVIYSITGSVHYDAVRNFTLAMLGLYTAVIAVHLWISTYNSSTARNSVMEIVRGNLGGIFWSIVIGAGIVVPLVLTAFSGPDLTIMLAGNALFVLAGNLALRYVILRAGRYSSLLPQ